MILPATIISILPDDRLRIEFRFGGHNLQRIVPRPLDMHQDAKVGSTLEVDYDDYRDVTRLHYVTLNTSMAWQAVV